MLIPVRAPVRVVAPAAAEEKMVPVVKVVSGARVVAPVPATVKTPDLKTLSHPVPILIAFSVPAPAVIVPMLTPFKVPAPTPAAMTLRPCWVPPVVIEPVVTETPLAVRVPVVCVRLELVMKAPVKVSVPAAVVWVMAEPVMSIPR